MKLFNKIAIIGVGLIGGSIGLAVRKYRLADEVVGVCRRESSRRKAVKLKAVDRATLNLREGVKNADLVIIAAPVGKIYDISREAVRFMKKGTMLIEVGSTKEELTGRMERLCGKKVKFVGVHPMAGSEKTGVENASSDIFDKASLILIKTKNADQDSIRRLGRFWKKLGSRIFILDSRTHDERVALTSYLPHVVSAAISLMQTKETIRLAGGSLRDATRVSASHPELWRDIFLSARKNTLNSISLFLRNVKAIEKAIRNKDKNKLIKFLENAKEISDRIRR